MNNSPESNRLDKLLTEPLEVKDDGFSELVDLQLQTSSLSSEKLIMKIAIVWTTVSLLLASPDVIRNSLEGFILKLNNLPYSDLPLRIFPESMLNTDLSALMAIVLTVSCLAIIEFQEQS